MKIVRYSHEKNTFYDADGNLFFVQRAILHEASEIYIEVELRVKDLAFLVELESDPARGINDFYLVFSKDDYHIRLMIPVFDIAWLEYTLDRVACDFGRKSFLK